MILQRRLTNGFTVLHESISKCLRDPNIPNRIRALQQLKIDQTNYKTLDLHLQIPHFLKMCTAKQLHTFHKQNKTHQNCIVLHALAHIQFNACMAYIDTCLRFAHANQNAFLWEKTDNKSKKQQFSCQMKKIAIDQGRHCLMLIERLSQLNVNYGDFPVISNLTNTVIKTSNSVVDRLALISIVHEGKGIASAKRLIKNMQKGNDQSSAKIIRIIHDEEPYHFKCGLKWFKFFVKQKGDKNSCLSDEEIFQKELTRINQNYKTNIIMNDLKDF